MKDNTKETLKKAAFVVTVLFIAAMTLIPVASLWGSSFYKKAGDECYDIALATQNIFDYQKYSVDQTYYPELLKELKK